MKNNYFFMSSKIIDIKLCKSPGGGDPDPPDPSIDLRMLYDYRKNLTDMSDSVMVMIIM